jgi:succinyl-diaminopimelate desuccinylase
MAGPDLARRTLELVDIASTSREEADVMRYVAESLPGEPVWASDDVRFVVPRRRESRPLVIFAGHVDTVPAQANLPGRVADGSVVGLGASDMKGGVAVMIELTRWCAQAETALDAGFVFFTREEIALVESPLPALFATGLVDDAALAVVMEPTDNTIQVGCVGGINAAVRFHGEAAHSARPWTGVNAIVLAAEMLLRLPGPADVIVDGLLFRETITPTIVTGGIARNVVPDHAEVILNFRYAPGRSRDDAVRRLGDLIGAEADWSVLDHSPAANVNLGNPLVERLRAAGEFEIQPKQAWTPVAQFVEQGIDAVNLGPGATRFAHRRDEQIEIAALERCFAALQRFLSG